MRTVLNIALLLSGWLAVTLIGDAGGYYYGGGCGHTVGYYQYYTPTYYQPAYTQTVYPPAPAAQTTCYNTPAGTVCNTSYANQYANVYNTPVETFYRVAPDLAQAKIAEQVAEVTLTKFRAEMKQQEAEKRDTDFKTQVLQMLAANQQARGGFTGGGSDSAVYQLQAENQQLRAALDKLSTEMQRLVAAGPAPSPQPQPRPNPTPEPGPNPPARPSVNVPTDPGQLVALVKTTFGASCMPCHQQQGRLNLTDPSKLFYEDWADVVSRISSEEPETRMPPAEAGKASPTVEQFRAIQKLQAHSTHRPKVPAADKTPPIPPGK